MSNKMTTSCSFGKSAIGHDNRKFEPKNADPELSKNNEYLVVCNSTREAYEDIFGEAVEAYNNSQKRADRKISSYYDKIKESKNGEHLSYEYVIQVGSHETNPTGGPDEEISKEIYREWLDGFTEKYPSLKIINAAIHCDEPNGTPHMHITFVPVAQHQKGLKLRNSLSGALKEIGYSRITDWCLDVQNDLGDMLRERGIGYEQLGTHREHIENGLFQELMDKAKKEVQTELSSIEIQISQRQDEISRLNAVVEKIQKQELDVEKIDDVEVKKMPLSNNVIMSRDDYNTISTAAKKLAVYEKQDGRLQMLLDKANETISALRQRINQLVDVITGKDSVISELKGQIRSYAKEKFHYEDLELENQSLKRENRKLKDLNSRLKETLRENGIQFRNKEKERER